MLALDPEDADALQAQLFLLLKTSKYQEALKVTDGRPEMFRFERAYALYRVQREKEAEELLKDERDRAVAFLKAQIVNPIFLSLSLPRGHSPIFWQSYRLGEYARALDIYTTLLSTSNPALEEYSDIQTNIAATETNLTFLQTGFQSSIHSLPAHLRGQRLEDTPLPPLTQTHVTAIGANAGTGVNDANTENPPPKPKSPRKSRVPKGIIPGVSPPPDPERWIKKSERTRVEGHGKKKKGGGGATQGSTSAPQQAKPGGQSKGKKKK